MEIGSIRKLYRYPIKSLLGEDCKKLQLDNRGVKGDRLFAIVNSEGKFGSGKNTRRFRKIDGLLELKAHYLEDCPMITFPYGRIITGNALNINELLSQKLSEPLTLKIEEGVSHLDAGPIHILTSSSIDWLKSRLPSSEIDERRFRPNILLETEGKELIEESWIGKKLNNHRLKTVG